MWTGCGESRGCPHCATVSPDPARTGQADHMGGSGGIRVLVVALLSWAALLAAGSSAGGDAPAPPTGFVLPVPPPPVLLTPFTPPTNRFGAGHRGVDLAAPEGSAVVAAGAGVVVFAGLLAGRGVVSIEHQGGLRTTYEPVTATVPAGTRVTAGGVIGALEGGHPGCAPASCLHWGARLPDRVYLDPMSLLQPWRVRLLPWDGR